MSTTSYPQTTDSDFSRRRPTIPTYTQAKRKAKFCMVNLDDMFTHTKGIPFRDRLTGEAEEFMQAVEARMIEEQRPPVYVKVRDALAELGVDVGATTVADHFKRVAKDNGFDIRR